MAGCRTQGLAVEFTDLTYKGKRTHDLPVKVTYCRRRVHLERESRARHYNLLGYPNRQELCFDFVPTVN